SRRLDLIGDMIFGTAPLAYKGMNTKVHYKRDKDPQIVLSKLFTINPQDADVTRRTSFSSINSDWSTASDDDRSHYSGYSVYPPILGLRSSSKASFNSKRSRRFSQTSMEDGVFRPMPMPGSHSSADTNNPEGNHGSAYALAVVITLDDKNKALFDFVFSHFCVIENHLHRLQAEAFQLLCDHFRNSNFATHALQQVNKPGHLAYLESGIFQHDKVMIDAVMHFKRAFYDLYGVPRIQEPLWLNMSTFPQRKSDYAASLVKELVYLIDGYDNDAYSYMISSIVTAVLMYHLSWVQTVVPPEEFKNVNCRHGNYDPLWAQLSDLYGFVASPGRIARTVVIGQKGGLVRRILYILTYLIRCNEVYENVETLLHPDPDSIFSQEREKDITDVTKLEDKIVKQLIGTATDVESIAIPKAHTSSGESISYHPTESPDSLNDNISSASYSSTVNASASTHQWSSTGNPVISSNGVYPVVMPKSSIYQMAPDITQIREDGIPTEPAHQLFAKSYGRSLMGGYCDTYKSDFVLLGVSNGSFIDRLEADLKHTLPQFALTDEVTEAACLIIDTEKW
ncbi:folliculin-interacting protein middle domain-containing protein, partial [Fennellomyces sp. T-0311]